MHITIATDAWAPQVNGVSRTLQTTVRELRRLGHEVQVVHPLLFRHVRCPFTIDVELALDVNWSRVAKFIHRPGAVHISTEGPVGFWFRRYCVARGLPFTTAFHTNFPEYLYENARIPVRFTAAIQRRFHAPAAAIMVATPSVAEKLKGWRFAPPTKPWSRGIDRDLFHPRPKTLTSDRPVAVYVGRVAKEKNIEAFLSLGRALEKYVVGDGPERESLQRRYPNVHFTGTLTGESLGQMYANADVFVFPSRTDTFGLVVIEALACGVPVAAFPVMGPKDILGHAGGVGCCDEDLARAVDVALTTGNPAACVELANCYSWEASTRQFVSNLAPFR